MTDKHRNALQSTHELFWYRIERVLGQGAFGITYLAHDINLDRKVAIKEYLPAQLCMRDSNQTVQPLSPEHADDFKFGLERFITEARTLTKFEHPNLIRVFNVFEANNTAYMVMNYETGESLQNIAKHKKSFSEEELRHIMLPLMNGLQKMHSTGFIHRDIKPGNIFIRSDNSPVLLDFGSARQTRQANPQTLTNFVSPGYAPIEQYASKSDKQGPWTDIYGLGATIYKLITGTAPINAIDRSETISTDLKDCYISLASMPQEKYSKEFMAAIDHALVFRAQERPQSIEEWRNEFNFAESDIETVPVPLVTNVTNNQSNSGKEDFVERTVKTVKTTTPDTGSGAEETTVKIDTTADEKTVKQAPPSQNKSNFVIPITVFISLLVIVSAFGIYKLMQSSDQVSTPTPVTDAENPDVTTSPVIDKQPEIPAEQPAQSVETTSPGANDEINRLLKQADENVKALKLTSPKDNNAYDQYLQVLAMDLENQQARDGIHNISDKYIALSYSAMNVNDLNRAALYIDKAEKIWPESTKIAPARSTLEKAKQQQSETTQQPATKQQSTSGGKGDDASVFDNVKEWLKNNTDNQKNSKKKRKSNELDQKILDAM